MNNRLLLCLLFVCTLFCGCTKDPIVPNNIPTVELREHTNLLRTSVDLNGYFTAANEHTVTKYGFKLGSSVNIEESLLKDIELSENKDGSFTTSVNDLEIGETYFYIAYVSNGAEEIISEVESFTTSLKAGAKLSKSIASLNSKEEVVLTSSVIDDGGSAVTSTGFCWSTTNPQPTIADGHAAATLSSSNFSATTSNLEELKTYYIRAYADNGATSGTQTFSYSEALEYTVPNNTINISDANFKSYLLGNFDTNSNGEISKYEAANIKVLDVNSKGIASLKGIETMVNLTSLNCADNKLTSIDLSKNTQLTYLYCFKNQLSSLDLSSNRKLTFLHFYNNQLTSLDVSSNRELDRLDCSNNQLTSLDVSECLKLNVLYCVENQIDSLDISNNRELTNLRCEDNAVSYVRVWEGFDIDDIEATYDEETLFVIGNDNPEDYELIDVPDSMFKAYLVRKFDTNNDDGISVTEAKAITVLNVTNNSITSVEGIEEMVNLNELTLRGTASYIPNPNYEYMPEGKLTSLDISRNRQLAKLNCENNQLSSLDLSKNNQLLELNCSGNQLPSLNISECMQLTHLSCDDNQLTTIDLSNNSKLEWLSCSRNQLTSLDVTNNTNLEWLNCTHNKLLYVTVWDGFNSDNLNVFYDDWVQFVTSDNIPSDSETIDIPDANFKAYLLENYDLNNDGDISNLEVQVITKIEVGDCNIASLEGIEYMVNLTYLNCDDNQLTTLDFSNNNQLLELRCSGNQLTSLNILRCPQLTDLSCDDNQLTAVNLFNNSKLYQLSCARNQLTSLNVNKTQLTVLNVSNNTQLTSLNCDDNQLISLNISGCTQLSSLYCSNNYLTSLNVSNNTQLTSLNCDDNQLISLNISGCTQLSSLYCSNNYLTSLDVSNNKQLQHLECDDNQLTTLDVSSNTDLIGLSCGGNQLTSLDVSSNTDLIDLYCYDNQLTSIDLSNNTKLTRLWCWSSQLTSIDLSNNAKLKGLRCYDNPDLYYIYVWKGFDEDQFDWLRKDDQATFIEK